MKTELKAKFLQYLNQKNQDEGFTLIELLVVIIIIGTLSAIALPSFLNQANKGKQAEAKQYAGSMNRAQQAYYLEQDKFVSSVANLGIDIKTDTENYQYTIGGTLSGSCAVVTNKGTAKKDSLKSYAGVVALSIVGTASDVTTLPVLCEANNIGTTAAVDVLPSGTLSEPTCPSTFTALKPK